MTEYEAYTAMLLRAKLPFTVRQYPEGWVTRSRVTLEVDVPSKMHYAFDEAGMLFDISWTPEKLFPTPTAIFSYNMRPDINRQ